MPRELPKIKVNIARCYSIEYYVDKNLKEVRDINNPHNKISFVELLDLEIFCELAQLHHEILKYFESHTSRYRLSKSRISKQGE